MIHQLLIKIFLLIFVINVQLIGLRIGSEWWMKLALINLVWLIVLLFQHRADLTDMTPEGKRILFAPGVFLMIALAVWLWLYGCVAQTVWDQLLLPAKRGSFAWALLFWVTTVLWFSMLSRWDILWRKIVQWVVALLILLGLWWIGLQIGWLWEYLAFERDGDAPVSWVVVEIPEELDDSWVDEWEIDRAEGDTSDNEEVVSGSEEELPSAIEYDPDKPVLYSDAIPLLVGGYKLAPKNASRPTFALIPQDSQLYEDFRIAQQFGMVWTNINPSRIVQCENAMVLRGLAEWWTVRAWLGVLDAYWAEAQQRNLTQWACIQRDNQATASTLLD